MSEPGQARSQLSFIKDHMFASFNAPKVDLTGRTALVTGGNAGLGYETVLHFARNDASRIIIASRNRQKCEAAAQKVFKDVPSFRGKVDVMTVDLASFQSVIDFDKDLKADNGRVDLVVANAGIIKKNYGVTADGYEEVLQVNGLSTGLFSLLLLPILERTAALPVPPTSPSLKPTLCIVASDVHYWAKFPQQDAPGPIIDALNAPSGFIEVNERYNMSKVLDVFMAREIAKLPVVTSGRVRVSSANPGLCVSALRDDMGPRLASMINSMSWSTEKGARNFLWATTQPFPNGAFISLCKPTAPSLFVVSQKGKATQEKYWKEAVAIWRKLAPEVEAVL